MSEPLRKCVDCGLEAYTIDDLEKFSKRKTAPYGRENWCYSCRNKYQRKRYKPKPKPLYLRKCMGCGLEAYIEEDLELFVKDKNKLFGRRNLCKKCVNLRVKKHTQENPLPIRYSSMMTRCYKPNRPEYPNYGGRGIIVCEEWRNSRQAFYDWANANGFKPELTLDRIDNDKGYSPHNCRWATYQEQNRNNRNKTTNYEKRTRICHRCKQEKPLVEFDRNKSRPLGYGCECKTCRSKREKQWRN